MAESRAVAAALALAALVLLAGCLSGPRAEVPRVPADRAPPVRFAVVGDTGTGEPPQYQVAAAIGRVCAARGCDFVVHTGDIIYDVGPVSANDPQFRAKFESPYGPLGLPVWLVLGNHDVGGNPGSPGDLAQWSTVGERNVAYSARADRPSEAWRLPARWYAHQHGPVAFAAFDTSAFVFSGFEAGADGPLRRAMRAQEDFAAAAWPANATWRLAVGHHPYASNGVHGGAGAYDGAPELKGGALKAFYEAHVCGAADLLVTGHDHDLQWLEPVPSCGATRFLVSGAGARPRPIEDPARNAALFQLGDTLGFWWLEADGPTLRLEAYDGDARLLYSGNLTKPEA